MAITPFALSLGGRRRAGVGFGGATGNAPKPPPTDPFMTDPGYLSALAAEQSGTQVADATLKAIRDQAIVQFGDPSLAEAAGLTIDPLTGKAAAANTAAGTSTIAGYQRTRDVNQQNVLDTLGAHGMLDSGQTGYATLENQKAYGRDVYGGLQTALGGLNTAAAENVATKRGLHSDVTKALLHAYDLYVQNPQFWGAAGTGGPKAAANSAATTPVTAATTPVAAALSPNNRAGPLGVGAPRPVPRLGAYGAGTARGGRPG